MSDKELEEYINKIEPNFNSHLEKGTIEMSNEYFNLLEERMARLINENQELKAKIKTYEDPEDLTLMFMYCDEKAKDNIKELKKQLEKSNTTLDTHNELIEYMKKQQQKFIDYLENCINELKKESMNKLQNTINLGIVDITKEILSKYNEIIGVYDDNK